MHLFFAGMAVMGAVIVLFFLARDLLTMWIEGIADDVADKRVTETHSK